MSTVKSDLLLLLVAFLWGVGFIFQKASVDYIDALSFNGVRFLIGGVMILALAFFYKTDGDIRQSIISGVYVSFPLFFAAAFQQMGLYFTTAGNASFVTSAYIIIVTILSWAIGYKVLKSTLVNLAVLMFGIYLMSVVDFKVNVGDLLVFISAFLWAVHTIMLNKLGPGTNVLVFASVQFILCAILSFIFAPFMSDYRGINFDYGLLNAVASGTLVVAVAYFIQIVVLRVANPVHAVMILSLEALFGFIAGILLLSEPVNARLVIGATLIMVAVLNDQSKILTKLFIKATIKLFVKNPKNP